MDRSECQVAVAKVAALAHKMENKSQASQTRHSGVVVDDPL
jgi:hypothetical protein